MYTPSPLHARPWAEIEKPKSRRNARSWRLSTWNIRLQFYHLSTKPSPRGWISDDPTTPFLVIHISMYCHSDSLSIRQGKSGNMAVNKLFSQMNNFQMAATLGVMHWNSNLNKMAGRKEWVIWLLSLPAYIHIS